MSAERQAEHVNPHQAERHRAELQELGNKQLEQLRQSTNLETNPDRPEDRAEAAREIIAKHEAPPPAPEAEVTAPPVRHPILNLKLNYAQTLASLQRQLRPASRTFSKIIHTPIVESVSTALESTVARPSVLLGASWAALIVGGGFYLTARHYGYSLSGSEMLLSFIFGALLGLAGETLLRSLKRRQ